jgi:hypothetical protein
MSANLIIVPVAKQKYICSVFDVSMDLRPCKGLIL